LHQAWARHAATRGAVEVPQAISRAQLPFAPEWLLRLCAHHAPWVVGWPVVDWEVGIKT
jgi:hypothetical protein